MTQTKAITYEDRTRLFWLLSLISLFSLGIYIYAINSTAHNIALRHNLEREVASLSAELGSLEFEHIALKNAVTLEVAARYGFREVKEPLYVSRPSSGSLTLNR